jgi:hypothetical protein
MKRVVKQIFICDKCLNEITYTTKDQYDSNFEFSANECWEIKLGRAGYGSKFDGSEVDFDVCDDCLHEWVSSFKNSEVVFNSGSNVWYGDEEWAEEKENEED